MLRFSIRIQWKEQVFFLRSWYNFRSGLIAFFKVTYVYNLNPESGCVGDKIRFELIGFKTTLIEFAPMIVLS